MGYDGDQPVDTPYEDCTLIMSAKRFTPGITTVRFGRYIKIMRIRS